MFCHSNMEFFVYQMQNTVHQIVEGTLHESAF